MQLPYFIPPLNAHSRRESLRCAAGAPLRIARAMALPLLVACSFAGYAQTLASPLRPGIILGWGAAWHGIDGLSCEEGCPKFTGGFGNAPFAGVSLDWSITQRYGALLRVQYVASTLAMHTTTASVMVKDAAGNPVPLVRTYTIDAALPEVLIGVSAAARFGPVTVDAGPSLGMLTRATWESTASIDSPGNVTYGDNRTDTTFFPRQTLSGARSVQAGIAAGARYFIPVTERTILAPEIRLLVPLTSLRDETPWHETIAEVGCSLLFTFPTPPPPAAPPESPGGRGH